MTKNEIVYNLLNLMTAGRINDDFTPSVAQLSFIIDYKRAQYLRQDQTKNYFDNDLFYQDLGCIPLIKVDKAECCEFETNCDILRTEFTIPKTIRFKDRYALKVSAIDRQSRFSLILPERSPFYSERKYPGMTLPFYYLNDYLYFPTTLDLKVIDVRAILEKPEDARTFVCGDGLCYTDNSNYPLSADLLDLITKDILGTELKFLLGTTEDTENDAMPQNNINGQS
jgi:hypothetical protein